MTSPAQDRRRRFLGTWREVSRRRFDELHAADYDEHDGYRHLPPRAAG